MANLIRCLRETDAHLEHRMDASAALGIISRKGLGKVRHLDTSHLWIQEVNAKREMEFSKIAGCDNMADLMTKNLTAETTMKHFHVVNRVILL